MRIQINSSLACCVLVTTLWLVCDADAWGAGCSRPDISALKKAILTTDDRDVILMAAAIGQEEVLPELRKRMKPIDFQSPEGAAEAAAARLGDAKAIQDLSALLIRERDRSAAKILGFAGTEQTLR